MDPNAFEKALSPFENDVSRAIQRVDENNDFPSDEDFAVLINFIALLSARNPKLRRTMEEFETEVYKRVAELSVSKREVWERRVQGMNADGYEGPDLPYEEMRDFIRRGEYGLEFPVGHHIETELNMVDAILPYLFGRQWTLMIAKSHAGHFVCSDRPVAIMPTTERASRQPLGFGLTETDVTIPLNKRLALSGSFEGRKMVLPVDYPLVAMINANTTWQSERFVYSPDKSFKHYTREGIKSSNSFL